MWGSYFLPHWSNKQQIYSYVRKNPKQLDEIYKTVALKTFLRWIMKDSGLWKVNTNEVRPPTIVWSYCLEVSKSQREMGRGRNGLMLSGVTELSGKSWESGNQHGQSSQSKVLRRESCWDRTLCSAFPKAFCWVLENCAWDEIT